VAKGNGHDKNATPEVLQALMALTGEVSAMREEMATLPERTAGKAVALLFEQLRELNREDFLKMKFASVFNQDAL
jgi:hypothetical protein